MSMTTSTSSPTRFWGATAVGAVAFAILWWAAVSPAREDARAAREESRMLAARIERHFAPKGEPLDVVEKALAGERESLVALGNELGGVALEIPPEYEPGPDRDPLYFQKQLSEFRGWVRASAQTRGVPFANTSAPLGFREGISEDVVAENLARLAVGRRFIEVAGKSGVRSVLRAQQITVPSFRVADVAAAGIQELPFKVTVAADEESLVRLVQEMSRPGQFLSVRGLIVEVRRPASGTFEATLELAGVRVLRPVKPEGEGEAGVEPEAEPETEPGPEPGVLVPTAPAGEGRPTRDY